jgi:hypothetical protein
MTKNRKQNSDLLTLNEEPPKEEVCQNCLHSKVLTGLDEPTLICDHKTDARGTFCVVDPAGSCPNFDNCGHTPAEIADALAEGAKLLPLSQDKFAIVDAEDYEQLSQYKWHVSKSTRTFYASRNKSRKTCRREMYMDRLIINVPPGMFVDHIDHNGLNNRRSNLRLCTPQQNARNHRPQLRGSSKYKGVSWRQVWHNKKSVHLGYFKNEIDAAKAYDKAAKKFFGKFAYLNFPEDYDSKQNSVPFERGVSD